MHGFKYQLHLAKVAKKLAAVDETQVKPGVLVDLMQETRLTGKERTTATQRIRMALAAWVNAQLAEKKNGPSGPYYKINFEIVKI